MQHPDEGTIHAWLDGALSPSESRAFEARVAGDEALQAAVAEARGLIAASSRILGALDGVPGNVVPEARSIDESVASIEAARTRATSTRASRRWSAQRWAMAATIVVAVGVGLLYNAGDGTMTPADVATRQSTRAESAPLQPTVAASASRAGQGRSPSGGGFAKEDAAKDRERVVAAAGQTGGVEATAAIDQRGAAGAGAGAAAVVGAEAGKLAIGAGSAITDKANAPATTRDLLKAPAKVGPMRDAAEPAFAVADELRQKSAPVAPVAPIALNASGQNEKKAEKPKKLQEAASGLVPSASAAPDSRAQLVRRAPIPAPASATLTESIPDPRASAIGCRAVRFGEWSLAVAGSNMPDAVMLDSQLVAIGWRRARPAMTAGVFAPANGTWMVQDDSVRLSLPDVGNGMSLRALLAVRSGAGTATINGADGTVRSRSGATWTVSPCVAR